MTTIQDDFAPYIDKYGLVQPAIGGTSGNGLLYTALYAMALLQQGTISVGLAGTILRAYYSCEKGPGLMQRLPNGAFGQEGPDDYVGCGLAANLLGTELAESIVTYGRGEKWLGLISKYNYNNVTPGVFTLASWLGRQPQVICHLEFAAGQNPPLWRKLWWNAAITLACFAKVTDQDAHTLTWCLIQVADGKSVITQPFVWLWRKVMAKRKPGGISQNLRDYFGFDHPLVKWLK